MRVALLNPDWTFEGSIYFGCREPHLPLELGWARQQLEADGHRVLMLDGHLLGLADAELAAEVAAFGPDLTVVTTAPTYLFWRCAQPELRVPMRLVQALDGIGGRTVAVGPHGSTTPRAALRKLGTDAVAMGECEETLRAIAAGGWEDVPGLALWERGEIRVNGGPQAARFADAPALSWPEEWVRRHRHHHHRFDDAPRGPGAEVEASRGCPYSCSFCAKENFRDRYRRREPGAVVAEIAALQEQGVGYVYFIDEIFLPNRPLLEALVGRGLKFGVQTRIDLWKPGMLELLGKAGCVSIEAGVESLTREGRDQLLKNCRLDTEELAERLIEAKRHVPFVQANLLEMPQDDPAVIGQWRERLRGEGVWANDPVPLFPYPGSPDYRRLWGLPDEEAWERAVDYYLDTFVDFSELQEARPRRLPELERSRAA
ncbi:TIGR04295 family B12-binding domain-containing radical SAM protein [Marinimicrococcus flavescens]|uniref:TIGR04295 family B12-binding domain-containing radical SAM protein n=1 Tax=Marinimicrococcus flavescens TaxID=3031815 RepID=A0AAP3XR11_9PROT|nr:TIGR04295 family B12-binding domain-containing radical SAM protein [Marinimicrococcus flavescens]